MKRRTEPDNWWAPFERHPQMLLALIDCKRASWRYEQWLGLNGDTHQPIAADKDSPLLVIGAPGSNKSASVMVPNALLAPGALFCVSPRADIYRATARARAQLGKVWHFSAYGSKVPGAREVRFSLLQGCEAETEAHKIALRVASWVDRSEYAQLTSHKGHLHFRNHAHRLLFAFFHVAALTGESMGWVFKTLSSPSFAKTLITLMRELEDHPNFGQMTTTFEALTWLTSIAGEERGSAISTALNAISAYQDTSVIENSIDPNFDFDKFVRGLPDKIIKGAWGFDSGTLGQHGVWPPFRGKWDSLYITDASAESPAAAIYGEFEFRIREAIYRLSLERELAGDSKPMPITIVNDGAFVAPVMRLAEMLAEMRDRGVCFVMAIQSLSQARQIFGEIGKDFLTLFRTAIVFRGIKDKETLELISMLSGRYWQDVTSNSVTHGRERSDGTSTRPQLIESLRPDQVATGHKYWEFGALVLNSQAMTFWVDAIPYWRNEPWPRLLIQHLERSIHKESRLPLPRLEAEWLDELGLTQRYENLRIQFKQYSGR